MNETKFTPGPWILEFRNGSDTANIISSCEKRWDIAATFGGINDSFTDEGSAESKANAKLIAAAPDMFDAIKKALEIKQLWFPAGDFSVEHEGEAQALQSMFNALEAAINKATS